MLILSLVIATIPGTPLTTIRWSDGIEDVYSVGGMEWTKKEREKKEGSNGQ